MKTFDGNSTKRGASPTAKSNDNQTDLDADLTATHPSGEDPLPPSVAETGAFEQKILHGAVRRIIGTFVDNTVRKTAEEKLAHERELLQTLIDTIPVMITIYDPALQRFSFNQEFRRVLGWSEQEMSDGDPMEKFYPDPAEREAARQSMESVATG